jgi:hypothetical protein
MKEIFLIKTPTVNFDSVTESLNPRIATEVSIPLGVCYLAGILREKDFKVRIFDPHLEHYDAYMQTGDSEVFKRSITQDINFSSFDTIHLHLFHGHITSQR